MICRRLFSNQKADMPVMGLANTSPLLRAHVGFFFLGGLCNTVGVSVSAEKSTWGDLFRHLTGLDTSVPQFPHLENILPLQRILDSSAWQGMDK